MALAMLGFIPIFMPTYSILMPLLGGIPFIKEMPFEDAKDYVIKLTQFYSAGITTMK